MLVISGIQASLQVFVVCTLYISLVRTLLKVDHAVMPSTTPLIQRVRGVHESGWVGFEDILNMNANS